MGNPASGPLVIWATIPSGLNFSPAQCSLFVRVCGLSSEIRIDRRKSRDEPFTDDPNDYAVAMDGPVIGRGYSELRQDLEVVFAVTHGAIGYADSLDEAKEFLKQRWFEETKKLSQH